MNRSHTRDSYLRLLDRVRAARPDIALSGDFIVGFPGETEAEFADTLSLVDAVGYNQVRGLPLKAAELAEAIGDLVRSTDPDAATVDDVAQAAADDSPTAPIETKETVR